MPRLFGSIAALFVGLSSSAPVIDVEQLKSDSAGAIAYAALAQAAPVLPPQPVKTMQQATEATKTIKPTAAEAQITASAPAVVPPSLPPSPPAHTPAAVRPTFAPARAPTLYYPAVGPSYGRRFR